MNGWQYKSNSITHFKCCKVSLGILLEFTNGKFHIHHRICLNAYINTVGETNSAFDPCPPPEGSLLDTRIF